MRVYLGADHQGFFLKNKVRDYLTKAGYQITDYSNEELDPDDDFPKYAKLAAKRVVDEKDDTDVAILVCGGGQGMCMAANRIKGVRAIVASSVEDATYGRNDNDANVLCLPARVLDREYNIPLWRDIVDAFMNTPFAGAERYIRRNRELDQLD
ncbi:RpiB/LacA/LacB family sugar-phosphate isomerase [Candidatus Saccharibacteria bacterium]|jgi:sugar-phosphate isomerase, RpiB/LacA/LacB family|uniref:RpiB/LacA/LacB family sugar-phosphate isomerase n=1 Tax=Candidatus Nanoperiomorbus periodonticus TaxID=2171989 RepID=UPI00101CCFA4|nr:RpiB/LacA/LacB family sugar-phosphate isomerase [Candidatus Nanoperiomorbus periodonticus]MBB1556524.1 RpiB/LacA/LacB family sugar-phosphate isomerase [Candidatus Saccharibacteria bacterium]MCG5079415.1 RpiB/LacA/LacB family sugar-phosphate isomerase [Candidatus Saccharibacteria bacterium]MCG5106076.1 RpiB/LacA/LacB family sugar-phosphate isomerase [Candidatus Saccharibacteria bacterium]RYC76057.1 Ribose-5-phosphate isomerase B [Candidatus Nanoperiomorbus periodonticus]RYC76514.1 Ribose-5-p